MPGEGLSLANQRTVARRGDKAAPEKPEAAAQPEFLSELPEFIPENEWLVHNNAQPGHPLGTTDFQAWLQKPDPANLETCNCGWASELGQHFRVIWSTSPQAAASQAEAQRRAEANILPTQ
jgi:hypothetical protein